MRTVCELCIVENALIDDMLASGNEEFLKVFAEEESTYCFGRIECLAARFAAKKAVSGLLGARDEIQWNTIIVRNHSSGVPYIILLGSTVLRANDLKIFRWYLSLTHTDQYAAAFVVAER